MPEERPQARRQRRLLQNTRFSRPIPLAFQGRKDLRGKATSLLLEQDSPLALVLSMEFTTSTGSLLASGLDGSEEKALPFAGLSSAS